MTQVGPIRVFPCDWLMQDGRHMLLFTGVDQLEDGNLELLMATFPVTERRLEAYPSE